VRDCVCMHVCAGVRDCVHTHTSERLCVREREGEERESERLCVRERVSMCMKSKPKCVRKKMCICVHSKPGVSVYRTDRWRVVAITHYNTLQHPATHCNALQHTAT